MRNIDKYTTTEKIAEDKGDEESKKIMISTETYAVCELLNDLGIKINNFKK